MSDLTTQIEAESAKAASVSSDGTSVSRRSLAEVIAADKYLKTQSALSNPGGVLRALTTRIVPPGGTGE